MKSNYFFQAGGLWVCEHWIWEMKLIFILFLNIAPPFTPCFWVWRHLQARKPLLLSLSQKYLDSFFKFCIYNFMERLLKTEYLLSFVSQCPTSISFLSHDQPFNFLWLSLLLLLFKWNHPTPNPDNQNLSCFGHHHPQWIYDWFRDGQVCGNHC